MTTESSVLFVPCSFGNTATATGQEEDYRLRLYSSLSLERTEVEVESWDKNGPEAFVIKQ